MELILTRIAKRRTYTIGRLYIKDSSSVDSTPLSSEAARATGVFREATECGFGPTKGSESPFATEARQGGGSSSTYFCDTLEPTALELKTTVSKEAVLRSPTKLQSLKPFAIPEGRYAVVITWSPKFQMWLPLLLGGPDFNRQFKGIRIHAGNTAKDTAGCILVGRNQLVGKVLESRKWLYELKQKIVEAKARNEPVWLTIQ